MLKDLDELVAECPDPRSRKYIQESVQCYKAGAYRSAVVSCWIAVVFDLIDKIREVAASGDAKAQEVITKFDRARSDGDLRSALAFEKELLHLARDSFEFISPIEFIDLERLAVDRNRCAHPSLVSDTEVFQATPELARLHIVNAAQYVLSQPAAQGKKALERLVAELDSNFFPAKHEDVVAFLRGGPLAKPRLSLLRSYLDLLLKRLLRESSPYEDRKKATKALAAISEIHPESWKRLVPELLGKLMPTLLSDNDMECAALFFGTADGSTVWPYLGATEQLRLATFVENAPATHMDSFGDLFGESLPLTAAAEARIKKANSSDIFAPMWFTAPTAAIDRMLHLYRFSSSESKADEFANRMRYALMDSKTPAKHLEALVLAAAKGEHVRKSKQFWPVLKEFAERNSIEREKVTEALAKYGLEIFE
ncbi:hypothetical protein WK40_04655 [Burkholderia cepacia]|uniref:hypothetical protein n=3 Tax=Burkholderia cepacia TaxID=292 RepID=UPI00076CD0F2|nr:hypothetical protein [Burkholderia cepacia]KVS69892.1 hypothetical protein WK40_04655 [Burkholderia cepacia]